MSGDADLVASLTREAQDALNHWPQAWGAVSLVKHRENAVFSVHCDKGRRYAVRLHRRGYHSDEALETELAWMADLRRSGLPVPDVLRTREGRNFCRAMWHGAGERPVDLIEWLPGEPVGCSERGMHGSAATAERQMHALGAIMARMHDHAGRWRGLPKARRHAWDVEGLAGPKPLWGRFWDLPTLAPDDRALLVTARDRALADLREFGTGPDRYGLIHADLVPENVLSDGDALFVIDFDDSGFGWHVFDMATALCFTVEQPHHDAMRAALLAGYRTVRPLPRRHEAMLPLFLFLRSTTYLGWMQTRPDTALPDGMANALIARSMRLTRDYLEQARS